MVKQTMLTDILLFLTGIIVGVMNALAGGGMLIGFPALVLFGVPPIMASATGAIITSPGQLASAFGYRKFLRKVPLFYAWLLVPCVIGASAGALILRHTSADHFANIIPVLVLFGVLLFAFQPLIHFHLHRHVKNKSKRLLPIILIGIAFLPLTVYAGYFGAGYGFIMLAFLGFTSIKDVHMMNGMKNITAVFISAASIVSLYSSHLIRWQVGFVMGGGAILGGYFGSRVAQKISSHWLRIIVILVGLAMAAYLGVRYR